MKAYHGRKVVLVVSGTSLRRGGRPARPNGRARRRASHDRRTRSLRGGSIELDGPPSDTSDPSTAAWGCSYLPQEASVSAAQRRGNFVAVSNCNSNERGRPLARRDIDGRLVALMAELQIELIRSNRPPVAVRRRTPALEIARALAGLPTAFILLDEPFAGFDPDRRHEFSESCVSQGSSNRRAHHRSQRSRNA